MTENDKKILEVYRKAKNFCEVGGLDLDEQLESEEAKKRCMTFFSVFITMKNMMQIWHKILTIKHDK